MEALNETLPVVIYLLLIVLLVVVKKVHSLDRVFNMIDYTTDKVTMISDTVVNFITSKLKRIIKFKKNDEEDEDDE